MDYDVIVVGGGLAGLTASAYLAKAGHSTLLLEKEAACGGLVHTFERDGFVFDGGIRAMENSGILFPMLRHLGLEVIFRKEPRIPRHRRPCHTRRIRGQRRRLSDIAHRAVPRRR